MADDAEPRLGDLVEKITTRLTTTLVIAAGIVALAIYARPAPPRYQAVAVGDRVVRVDARTGAMIACDGAAQCVSLHKPGGRIERAAKVPALPAPAAAPAAPAPAQGR